MSGLTAAQHAEKAEDLLASSKRLRSMAGNPDSAGLTIREGWARRAEQELSEANVHVALAVAKRERDA